MRKIILFALTHLLLLTTSSAKDFSHFVDVQVGGEERSEFRWGNDIWKPGALKRLNYNCQKSLRECYWNDQGVTGFRDKTQPVSIKSSYPMQVKFEAGVAYLARKGNPKTCHTDKSRTCRPLNIFWSMQGKSFQKLTAKPIDAHPSKQGGQLIHHRLKLSQDGNFSSVLLPGNDYKTTSPITLVFSEKL